MEQLDLAFRSAGIALLGLFAVITLRSKADLVRRLIGTAFYVSVAAYLICSSQFAAQLPRAVH
ncbi:MAG: hypothetical protein R3360_07935, partial [Alphaproteobacteria bacterium]|nr:hypothetical protein [Alphaproteobacteria bacterium]